MARKKPKKTASPGECTGYRPIAARYDVSERTIQSWVAKGMPCSGPLRNRVFRFAETDPWVESYREEADPVSDADKEARSRKLRAQAEQAELKLDEMRREREIAEGNILPRDEMTIAHTEVVTRARDRLLSEIPREIAKRFPTHRQKIFDVSTEVVTTCLEQLARDLEQLAIEHLPPSTPATGEAPADKPPSKPKKKTAKKKPPRKRPKKKR